MRHISKKNLNTVVETFQKKKNFALFDKFWYLKRAERFVQIDYTGPYVDHTENVCYTLHTSATNQLMSKSGSVLRASTVSIPNNNLILGNISPENN